jgi:DNA-binding response OmpR family regulator
MKKILVIYGYPTVRELLAEELSADGHLVVVIGELDLAEELICTLKPDLLIFDLHINQKDRWELLEEIQKRAPYLRILALTTYDNYETDLRESFDTYIIKSFRLNGLRQKVAKVLDGKNLMRNGSKISHALDNKGMPSRPL